MKPQTAYYLGALPLLPLLPLLYLQSRRVRREVPALPEAHLGVRGTIAGSEPVLRLLALGESTVAGVGVNDHHDGISGQLALALHKVGGHTVQWQVLARSGYTAAQVRAKLVKQIPTIAFDYILVGLGVNDTFHLNSPATFRGEMFKLMGELRASQPLAKIVVINLPPVGQFPAFPRFMSWVLGRLVALHSAALRDLPSYFEQVYYVDEAIDFDAWASRANPPLSRATYFSDGVHPSALTYAFWAQEISAFMVAQGAI